jgi:hypothetical protein
MWEATKGKKRAEFSTLPEIDVAEYSSKKKEGENNNGKDTTPCIMIMGGFRSLRSIAPL